MSDINLAKSIKLIFADPIGILKGLILRGGEGKGKGWKRKGRKRNGRKKKGEGERMEVEFPTPSILL